MSPEKYPRNGTREEPGKLNPNIKRRHKGPGLIRNKTVRATKPAQSLKVNWVIFCVTAYPFYLGHWLLPHFVARARSRSMSWCHVLLTPGSAQTYTSHVLGYLFNFFLLANWKNCARIWCEYFFISVKAKQTFLKEFLMTDCWFWVRKFVPWSWCLFLYSDTSCLHTPMNVLCADKRQNMRERNHTEKC